MSRQYRAEQIVGINGWDCGTEIEITMVVTFTVHPGCKPTLTEPGEEPSVEVQDIRFFNGKDEVSIPAQIGDMFAMEKGFTDWLMQEAELQLEHAADDAADAKRAERDLDRDLPF